MSFYSIAETFPSEQQCRDKYKAYREEIGIECDNIIDGNRCGCTKHWWLKSIEKWQCSKCNSRTNLRAGTIMEKSKTPFRVWFMIIYLLGHSKKTPSILEITRQIRYRRYRTVWDIVQKIMMVSSKYDKRYKLTGGVELDDAMFEVVKFPKRDRLGNIIADENFDEFGKMREGIRGRGAPGKQLVLVMAESDPEPPNPLKPYQKTRSVRSIRMEVMDDFTQESVEFEVSINISRDADLISDKAPSFATLKNFVKSHDWKKTPSKEGSSRLPWVHMAIRNAKAIINGIHHSVNMNYLQNYLGMYCFKFNNRYKFGIQEGQNGLFSTILRACAVYVP